MGKVHNLSDRELLSMYKTMTLEQIGNKLGVSRQAVGGRIRKYEEYNEIKEMKARRRREWIGMVVRMFADGMQPIEIADSLNVNRQTVYSILRQYATGYPRLKAVGCETCKTEPYAKGLCRNCYTRELRRSKQS